jgi:hypothetical protein
MLPEKGKEKKDEKEENEEKREILDSLVIDFNWPLMSKILEVYLRRCLICS